MFMEALELKVSGKIVNDDENLLTVDEENYDEREETNTNQSNDKTECEEDEEESNFDNEIDENETDGNDNEDAEIKKTENGEKHVVCPQCSKQFRNKKSLKSHVYDTHSGTKSCSLCPKTFENISTHRRHMQDVHKKREYEPMCSHCGKVFSNKHYLKNHEPRCHGEGTTKSVFTCQYCEKVFGSKSAKRFHEKKKHKIETDAGFYIISNEGNVDEPEPQENICNVCMIPQKFKSKQILKKNMKRVYEGKNDLIKSGKFTRYLSEQEVNSQESKRVVCQCCAEMFTCQQNLEEHKLTVHMIEKCFKCMICPKSFKKKRYLSDHMTRFHRNPSYQCTECGKKSKQEYHHKMHMKIHEVRLGRGRPQTPISSVKKRQQYNRTKDEAEEIKKKLFGAPESVKKSMWDSILKDCPYYQKLKQTPLTEAEVIQIINDNNLVDAQIVNICQFMRQKWGNGVITPNIKKKLTERKSLLDQFFTFSQLDSSTNLHFKTKKGKILSRSITYCHDIPGLIAFKKLTENVDESKEMLNVVGVDDGKQILKIVWNWSLMYENDVGKNKLMGPKSSIILAAVSKVKETHHNMKVLMQLTKLNEIEYAMSMDLKLINITIGICTHSSR